MQKMYYNRPPHQEHFYSRVGGLRSKRLEALQFVVVVVGLSLGINLLSSFIYGLIPYPGVVTGIFILITSLFIYSKLWRGIDGRYSVPLLLLLHLSKDKQNITKMLALVQGCGFGIAAEISEKMIEKKEIKVGMLRLEETLPVVESVVWWTISDALSGGWYFPGEYQENLNMGWVEGSSPKTRSTKTNIETYIPENHPYFYLDYKNEFFIPKGTKIKTERDLSKLNSTFILKNKYVTIRIKLMSNLEGPVLHSIMSPWVPKSEQSWQSVFLVQIRTQYHLRSKLSFSSRVSENIVWAERLAEYLVTHLSFRMFEESQDKLWHEKEIQAVERILGISRWN